MKLIDALAAAAVAAVIIAAAASAADISGAGATFLRGSSFGQSVVKFQ